MATLRKTKTPPLALVVWANIIKWMTIRGIEENEIAALLGITRLTERKQKSMISVSEMEQIALYLAIEPEKLMER